MYRMFTTALAASALLLATAGLSVAEPTAPAPTLPDPKPIPITIEIPKTARAVFQEVDTGDALTRCYVLATEFELLWQCVAVSAPPIAPTPAPTPTPTPSTPQR